MNNLPSRQESEAKQVETNTIESGKGCTGKGSEPR